MNEQNNRGIGGIIAAAFLFVFYTATIGYILFGMIRIYDSKNFYTGIFFQLVGTVLLFIAVMLKAIVRRGIDTPYHMAIVLCSVLYTVLLDCLNIFGSCSVPGAMFLLLHMLLLFVYLLIVVPMFITGKQ